MENFKKYDVCKYTKWDEENEVLENVWLEESVYLPADVTPTQVAQLLTDLEILPSSIGTLLITIEEDAIMVEDFGNKALVDLVLVD